jgi:hypothetical protein
MALKAVSAVTYLLDCQLITKWGESKLYTGNKPAPGIATEV